MTETSDDSKTWSMLAHGTGAISWFIAPSMTFIAPLIVMLVRQEDPVVAYHAKQAAIFQGAMCLSVWIIFVSATVLSMFCIGFLLYPLMFIPFIAGILYPVLGLTKLNNGEPFEYPLVSGMVSKPPEIG